MGLMSIETVNDNTVMIDFEMSGVWRLYGGRATITI